MTQYQSILADQNAPMQAQQAQAQTLVLNDGEGPGYRDTPAQDVAPSGSPEDNLSLFGANDEPLTQDVNFTDDPLYVFGEAPKETPFPWWLLIAGIAAGYVLKGNK